MKKQNHKIFKPFDKVLVRDEYGIWTPDIYSCFSVKLNQHWCLGFGGLYEDDILSYEGNEHLVGTTDEPEKEVKLEEGELLVYFESINYLENLDLFIGKFDRAINELIKIKSDCMHKWEFAIRFSDFNPNDMEETKKNILCVRNGKIVRYKE